MIVKDENMNEVELVKTDVYIPEEDEINNPLEWVTTTEVDRKEFDNILLSIDRQISLDDIEMTPFKRCISRLSGTLKNCLVDEGTVIALDKPKWEALYKSLKDTHKTCQSSLVKAREDLASVEKEIKNIEKNITADPADMIKNEEAFGKLIQKKITLQNYIKIKGQEADSFKHLATQAFAKDKKFNIQYSTATLIVAMSQLLFRFMYELNDEASRREFIDNLFVEFDDETRNKIFNLCTEFTTLYNEPFDITDLMETDLENSQAQAKAYTVMSFTALTNLAKLMQWEFIEPNKDLSEEEKATLFADQIKRRFRKAIESNSFGVDKDTKEPIKFSKSELHDFKQLLDFIDLYTSSDIQMKTSQVGETIKKNKTLILERRGEAIKRVGKHIFAIKDVENKEVLEEKAGELFKTILLSVSVAEAVLLVLHLTLV